MELYTCTVNASSAFNIYEEEACFDTKPSEWVLHAKHEMGPDLYCWPFQANPDPSTCLGVFGLSLYTTERDLREVFSRYGPLAGVNVVYDQRTGRSRGFAFVYFERLEDSKEVWESVCVFIYGVEYHLLWAQSLISFLSFDVNNSNWHIWVKYSLIWWVKLWLLRVRTVYWHFVHSSFNILVCR